MLLDSMSRTDFLSSHEKITSPVATVAITVRSIPSSFRGLLTHHEICSKELHTWGGLLQLCAHQDPEQTATSAQNNWPGFPILFYVVPFFLVGSHPVCFFNYVSRVSTGVCGAAVARVMGRCKPLNVTLTTKLAPLQEYSYLLLTAGHVFSSGSQFHVVYSECVTCAAIIK